MSKKKIVFVGGKAFGLQILRYLIETEEVLFVITNKEDNEDVWHTSVLEAIHYDQMICYPGNISDYKEVIRASKPDFLICHGYDSIIKPDILELFPKNHAINLHTGLTVQYRGRYPTVFPIIDSKSEAGITIHVMVEEVDAGPVYAQAKVYVDDMDTAETLYHKCSGAGLEKFKQIWPDIKSGKLQPKPIDISKSKVITKKDALSNEIQIWWNPLKIDKMVRALTFGPFKKPYFNVHGKKYELHYKRGKVI